MGIGDSPFDNQPMCAVLSYLDGSKSVFGSPSETDTMTITAVEAVALFSSKTNDFTTVWRISAVTVVQWCWIGDLEVLGSNSLFGTEAQKRKRIREMNQDEEDRVV